MANEGQAKIKQIVGLTSDLSDKVETASNQGSGGVTLFIQKTLTDLEFNRLGTAGSVVPDAAVSNLINFNVDISNESSELSAAPDGSDRLLIEDVSGGGTKFITVTNLLDGVSVDGIKWKEPVRMRTIADLDTDTSQVWAQAGAGIGATLTSDTASTTTLDGILLANGDRVGVMAQSTASENGVYIVSNAGVGTATVLTRATDFDESDEAVPNAAVFVAEGTVHEDLGFVVTTDGTITVDTDAINFAQFTGAGSFNAGAGLSQSGNTINVGGTTNRIDVSADNVDISTSYVGQASITTLGTVGTGTWEADTVAVSFGGTGLTSVTANSILITETAANVLVEKAVAASTILGRKSSGDIDDMTGAEARVVLRTRRQVDTGTLTANNMTLGTLSQTPLEPTKVIITINGLTLKEGSGFDFTVSGTTVTATDALNVAYGGTTNDGAGFENDDNFVAEYEH